MNRVFTKLKKPLWRANFGFVQWLYEGETESDIREEQLVERLYVKVELVKKKEGYRYIIFLAGQKHYIPIPLFSS